jgi:serine/threonine-protein kinase
MATMQAERAARMAIDWFGADRERVREVYRSVVELRARGEPADMVERLVAAGLLTADQAGKVHEALNKTQIDPKAVVRKAVREEPPAEPEEARPEPPTVRRQPNTIEDYRLLRKLGEGGMGEVYLAYHEPTDKQYAIKVLSLALAENAGIVERFRREAQHSIKLDHPNIVRGFAVGQDPLSGKHYLVMEYVDGPSLQSLLERHGQLAVGDAVHITLDIAHALEYAQTHDIVHRDIKPENILLTQTGVAKLADLGLAKQTTAVSHLTETRQGFGTPYYMPYEQALNAKNADARSDIYSLGATLYHLLTGRVPFPGESQVEIMERKEQGSYPPPHVFNPQVPEELELIIDKMMARDPRDRYQTASELIVDLERSGLAAPYLSFVNADVALRDPLVRKRVVSAGQVTQPDLSGVGRNGTPPRDLWYVRYHDAGGNLCKARLSTAQVIERIVAGRLDGLAQAAQSQDGHHRPLSAYPEFQHALKRRMEEAEADRAARRRRWRDSPWFWVAAATAAAAAVIGAVVVLLQSAS